MIISRVPVILIIATVVVIADVFLTDLLTRQNNSLEVIHGTGKKKFLVLQDHSGRYRISDFSLILALKSDMRYKVKVNQLPDNDIISIPILGSLIDNRNREKDKYCAHPFPVAAHFPLEATRSNRWRRNQYINTDGILPFQRCHSNEFYPGPEKLSSVFVHNGLSYQMINMAASMWGRTDEITGEPLFVNKIEVLSFYQLVGSRCFIDWEIHCVMPELKPLPNVTCALVDDGHNVVLEFESRFYSARSQADALNLYTRNSDTAAISIECIINRPFHELEHLFNDRFNLKLLVGDTKVPVLVDICYQFVEIPNMLHICTQPHYGYEKKHDKFWYGDPPYDGYNGLDIFLVYHTVMMGATVTFSDLHSSQVVRDMINPYRESGKVMFRNHWKMDDVFVNGTYGTYDYEHLCETNCIWEARVRSRWSMIAHAADNFVFPMDFNFTLNDVLSSLDPKGLHYMLVPIVLPGTSTPPTKVGNLLKRFDVLYEKLSEYFNERFTPLGNPRKIVVSFIHNIAIYDHVVEASRGVRSISSSECVNKYRLFTIHAMGVTREELNRNGGRKDLWYSEVANRLEKLLQEQRQASQQSETVSMNTSPYNLSTDSANLMLRGSASGLTCDKKWPHLEFFLPVGFNESQPVKSLRWKHVFLRSVLLFWPVLRSNMSIRLILDTNISTSAMKIFVDDAVLEGRRNFGDSFPTIVKSFNHDIQGVYDTERSRQSYIMFNADLYTNATYIAFVNSDTFIHSYADVDDIFDAEKPIIHGTIGFFKDSGLDKTKRDFPGNTYLALGEEEPMMCTFYFPVIVKASHLVDLRAFIAKKFQTFDKGFSTFSRGHSSHFNIMCAFLWWHKQNEYKWYIHDKTPTWNGHNPVPLYGQFAEKNFFTKEMMQPWPMLATRLSRRYSSPQRIDDLMVYFIEKSMCWRLPNSKFVFKRNNLSDISLRAIRNINKCNCIPNEPFFREMHSFGDIDFASEHTMPNKTPAILLHKERDARILSCKHSYLFI